VGEEGGEEPVEGESRSLVQSPVHMIVCRVFTKASKPTYTTDYTQTGGG
jgi:hypothetical protein